MNDIFVPIVILVAIVGIVAMIRRVSKRGDELKQLCDRGQAVVGKLTQLRKQRRSRTDDDHYITYTFTSGGGIEYSRELKVSEYEFADYAEGQAVDVVYLPDDPNINALKTLVDQMRDAINQRSAK